MAHRLFFTGRFGMHIDDDRVGMIAERAGRQFPLDRCERIVERVHEHPPHDLDNQNLRAVARRMHGRAAAGRARGIIGRAHQPVLPLDEDKRLALVPGMVAERDHIGAGIQEIVKNVLGYAKAAGGVFAVDDYKMNIVRFDEAGQPVYHGATSGFADNITQKQAAHAGLPLFVESPFGFLVPHTTDQAARQTMMSSSVATKSSG